MNYYLIDRKLYLVDLPDTASPRLPVMRSGEAYGHFFANARDITLVLIVDARHAPSAEDE